MVTLKGNLILGKSIALSLRFKTRDEEGEGPDRMELRAVALKKKWRT